MSEEGNSLQYHRSVGSSSHSLSEMSADPQYTAEYSLGMRPETKQLYRPDDRSIWGEWNPDIVHTDVQASSYAQECALILRREPHPSNINEVALNSVTVQSPLIKKVLDGTFEGFEGLNTQLKQLTFSAPFHPFYYRWHRFEKLCQEGKDQDTRKHLSLLHSVIKEEILPHIEIMQDLIKNEVISFEKLWTIFAPGMEVYTKIDGQDRIMLLRDSKYGASMSGEFFSLECRYIDCDGSSFGYVETSLEINSFDGVKKLIDLSAIPSHLHPDVEKLVEKLCLRGGKLEQLNGFHHRSYRGFYTARSSRQVRKRHVENGRIIIDPHTFNIHNMAGPHLESTGIDPLIDLADDHFGGAQNVIYKATNQAFRKYQKALQNHNKDTKTGSYRKYCLQSYPIRLVINCRSRQISEHQTTFDLYPYHPRLLLDIEILGAGELGETAVEIEDSLELVLELSTKWNAILLLDECDMFLEARTTTDIRRNRLVSVFLRKLEYYQGVMFLTTNRVRDFDAAFESRIHLTIHYPALDAASRLHIWKTFVYIGNSKSLLSDTDLETLAKNEINGRQIKNIIKTARLLSRQQNSLLSIDHIDMVLKVKKGEFH